VTRFILELLPELWTYFGVRSVAKFALGPIFGPDFGVAEWPDPFAMMLL
jgi:hypothetical protein